MESIENIQIFPKEKRNMDSQLVVDNVESSLNCPQMLEQEQDARSSKNFHPNNETFELNTLSNSSNTYVTVAQSISPIQSTSHIKHPKRILTMSPNMISPNTSVKPHNSSRQKNINIQKLMITDKPQIYCIRNKVIVIMKSKDRLCFTGKLLVKVLFGAVEIYGSVLNRLTGAIQVYSPRGYSNISIETSEAFTGDTIEDVWPILASEGIVRNSNSTLQMNIDNIQCGAAILMLQNFENNLTRFLNVHFSNFRLFPNINNSCYYSWTNPKRAEIVLGANLHLEQHDEPNYRRLIADSCITKDIAEKMLKSWCMNERSCTLIAGGKSVGKSTSVRYLINSLLRTSNKVVLVDVDPGQAECTPAGCISYSLIEEPLMGPNFTHLKMPVYQLFIDDINVTRCITRYIEGMKMLIEKLQQCPILSGLPIVVNTMGFTVELGWDIAIFTIKLFRPTIILQIMSSKMKNNFQEYLSAEVVNNQKCKWMCCDKIIDWNKPCNHDLCILQSQAERHKDEWNMEPYQQRELVMISYLSGIVHNNNDDSLQYNAEMFNINKMVPYTVPFSSLCIIPPRLFEVPASHVLNVINGNIVALCGIDLTEESTQESEKVSNPEKVSNLRVLTQRVPLCTCYGFGIIRGIDTKRQEVFINTPLPTSNMQYINCLAGCISIPPVLLKLNRNAPYVDENASLPTSRQIRKGVFRMKPHTSFSRSKKFK